MKVSWNTSKAKAAVQQGGLKGLAAGAQIAFEASQREVPVDTAQLKKSGKVVIKGKRATISYGAGLPDQRAVIVHEKLDLQHHTGTAKYLEVPVASSAQRVFQAIADGIRRTLR